MEGGLALPEGDGAEAFCVDVGDAVGGVEVLDAFAGFLAEESGFLRVLDEVEHVSGSVLGIGVRPDLSFFVGAVVFFELDELEGDGAAVACVYEFAGGGPVGGDDGFFEQHAFGDGESEAFGSVEGEVAVAGFHEAVGHLSREGFVDEVDVGQVFEQFV